MPSPLKKLSICARSLSVISAIEFVSKLKLSSRKSKLSTISEWEFWESSCHSCPEASYVSDPSEMSLDGVLLSLNEFKRRRGKWAICKNDNEIFELIKNKLRKLRNFFIAKLISCQHFSGASEKLFAFLFSLSLNDFFRPFTKRKETHRNKKSLRSCLVEERWGSVCFSIDNNTSNELINQLITLLSRIINHEQMFAFTTVERERWQWSFRGELEMTRWFPWLLLFDSKVTQSCANDFYIFYSPPKWLKCH